MLICQVFLLFKPHITILSGSKHICHKTNTWINLSPLNVHKQKQRLEAAGVTSELCLFSLLYPFLILPCATYRLCLINSHHKPPTQIQIWKFLPETFSVSDKREARMINMQKGAFNLLCTSGGNNVPLWTRNPWGLITKTQRLQTKSASSCWAGVTLAQSG